MTKRPLLLAVTATLLGACADEGERDVLVLPPGEGKADAADAVVMQGALALGGEASRSFTGDLEFHGYELAVRPGARVTIEVARRGTSSRLDTTLYVFGPRSAEGAYGATAIAFDDDAGWGRQSRLTDLALAEGGSYLVVVGTHDGRGRGSYRLVATCTSGDCAPLPAPAGACHPAFVAAIDACVADWLADPDFDPSTMPREELIAQCADIEPMAGTRDALCAAADAPSEMCALDSEALALDYLPTCRREAIDAWLDQACVFGERYRDLFSGEAIVVIGARALTSPDGFAALEAEQIVAAVRATAYDDVKTVDEAFAAVDEGRVNHVELWDASNRKAYTAYEVGAGDNSFGMIFVHGTTTAAARIVDGDLADCRATWGPERRRCEVDDHCADGARCVGRPAGVSSGRCIDGRADTQRAIGSACEGELGCEAGAGLVCAGAAIGGQGMCLPAWMRGTFASEPVLAIPDAVSGGVSAELLVSGLATVSMDVRLSLVVSHERTSDLRVMLTNPAGTEVVVFDGEAIASGEIYLDSAPLAGFPGDESVNGVWRLTVSDGQAGATGEIVRFGLDLTSRWD